jgi:hypothetical protein
MKAQSLNQAKLFIEGVIFIILYLFCFSSLPALYCARIEPGCSAS